jgi:hypothetical protein
LLLACAGALFAGSVYFMFQAGCAGDLKTGSVGDLSLALKIESKGATLGMLSVALAAASVARHKALSPVVRAIGCVAAVLVAWAVVTFVGLEAEARGVRSCWSAR